MPLLNLVATKCQTVFTEGEFFMKFLVDMVFIWSWTLEE